MKKYYGIGLVAICICVLIITPTSLGGVVGGKQHREGDLSAESHEDYTFEFEMGKDSDINATIGPKNLRERTKEECEKFTMRMWVDGELFHLAYGRLIYVENAPGQESLTCVIEHVGYGSGHDAAKKNRSVGIRLTNGNIWKARYTLDTN